MVRLAMPLRTTLAPLSILAALALSPAPSRADDLTAKGRDVAIAADCAACHTTPGGKDFAGGAAIASPVGAIYPTNITPSRRYGIGDWNEETFARAVRDGISPRGHLYPAMPYDSYSGMTDEDARALYAYFMQEVAPVDTPPAHQTALPFPFNLRIAMAGWDMLFLGHQRFAPKPGEDPQVARGRYLTDALVHCGTCHTPRNALFATKGDSYLAGAVVEGWDAPNITSDATAGLGGWSDAEIADLLRNGHASGKAVAGGPMGDAVEHSFRHLSSDDIAAIVKYLRTVPAKPTAGQTKPAFAYGTPVEPSYGFDGKEARAVGLQVERARTRDAAAINDSRDFTTISDGAILYEAACASCHGLAGAGTADHYYPSLYHSTATGSFRANDLVKTILQGVSRKGGDGATAMPEFATEMTDVQIAAVAKFVATTFGNPAMPVDAALVSGLRAPVPQSGIVSTIRWAMGLGVVIVVGLLAFAARSFKRSSSAIGK